MKQVDRKIKAVNKAASDAKFSGGQPSKARRKDRVVRAERQYGHALEREALENMGIEWFPWCENIGCK